MTITRLQFAQVAYALKEAAARSQQPPGPYVDALVGVFTRANPRFDAVRFRAAAYGGSPSEPSAAPAPITVGEREQLRRIEAAARDGTLSLLACTERGAGRRVPVLCEAASLLDGGATIEPLARLFDGDPFDTLNPPA